MFLTIGRKLALIALMFIIPTVYLITIFYFEKKKLISFSEKEYYGSKYINNISDFIILFIKQQDNQLHIESLEENSPVTDKLPRNSLKEAYEVLLEDEKLNRDIFLTRDLTQELNNQFSVFLKDKYDGSYGKILNTSMAIIRQVGDQSNMILDPELEPYYCMSVAIIRIPSLLLYLTKINNLLEENASNSPEILKIATGEYIGSINSILLDIENDIKHFNSSTNDKVAAASFNKSFSELKNNVSQYKQTIETELKIGKAFNKKVLGTSFKQIIKSVENIWNTSNDLFLNLIKIRINNLQVSLIISLSISFILIISALIYLYKVSLRIATPISLLSNTAIEIQKTNNYDLRVKWESQDEIGIFIKIFTSLLNQLAEELKRSRHEEELQKANLELENAYSELKEVQTQLMDKNDRLKEAVAQADYANESKSNFLANMSHELRTPLNAIIGLSELLVEDLQEEENKIYLEPMSRILNAGKHLLALINDVLDISKIEAGKMELFIEEFKIKDALDEILTMAEQLAIKNGNKIKFEYPDDIGTIKNDTTKFKQILINLISNSCKFTKNGLITLKVSEKTINGQELEFAIRDTGIGISPEQLEKLFSNFVQADSSTTKKFGGTGLGLAITKRICELMGGNINITSEVGKGTAMTITLPRIAETVINQESTTQAVKQKITQVQSVSDLKILVIEDNEIERELIDKYLKNAGYTVTFAVDGEEGLKIAAATHPDLIMLDLFLPGINGWDVLHSLKSNSKTWDINVVMISMLEEKNKGYVMGASDYLVKPFNQDQLTRVLSHYIINGSLDSNNLGRVLIVEDDDNARLILKTALKRFNVEIDEAVNGAEGLEKLAKNKPSLILLDLMMPVMDGFEFIENLKKSKEWAGIPVIVNTAKELSEGEKLKLEGSVAKILHKSQYSTKDMLSEVKMILETVKSNK